MVDLLNESHFPTMDELSELVRNPVFDKFIAELETGLKAKPALAFSRCSWQPGWNVKFRRAGKNLCTVYPHEAFFTVLVVISQKEREAAEAILSGCCRDIQEIYHTTQEGNGQRWLMIDLEDDDDRLRDALRLIKIRNGKNLKKGVDN